MESDPRVLWGVCITLYDILYFDWCCPKWIFVGVANFVSDFDAKLCNPLDSVAAKDQLLYMTKAQRVDKILLVEVLRLYRKTSTLQFSQYLHIVLLGHSPL